MQIFGESYFAPPQQENIDDIILEHQDELSSMDKADQKELNKQESSETYVNNLPLPVAIRG